MIQSNVDISLIDQTKFLNVGTVNTLINNLKSLQDQLGDNLKDITIFYRGHADKEWGLLPGIYRGYIGKEDYLVHNLIRYCPMDFQGSSNSFEKLVKMQHYELPTRLLDISTNPLVGLYFAACSEKYKNGELIIFFIRKKDISSYADEWVSVLSRLSFMSEEMVSKVNENKKLFVHNLEKLQEPLPYINDKSDLDKVICVLPKLDNHRIIRQHGAFFLFGIKEGKKECMSELKCSCIKFNIPAKKKETILTQLDQLGINEKFLFPEIDKVAHNLIENL